MKRYTPVVLLLSALAAPAAEPSAVAKLYDRQIAQVEKEVVSLVEAMPEDKFGFVPTAGEFKGVRNFASQVKHVAAVNYLVASAALGEKSGVDTGGENGPANVVTKAQVVKFLKDSYAYAHKAALSLTAANQTELVPSPFGNDKESRGYFVAVVVGHSFDHYGQMVVYARMNGIVPPASR